MSQKRPLTLSAISDDLMLTVVVSVFVEGEEDKAHMLQEVTRAATPQLKTNNSPQEVARSVSQRYSFASFSRSAEATQRPQ